MNKNKIIMSVIIGVLCVILVSVMFAQFKTVEETDITGIEKAREAELQSMLASWKTKYEEVEEKLADTQNKIDEYQSKIDSKEQASELLDKELEQTNLLVGKTAVTGEGIIVTLEDNSEKSIVASDLRTLINELKLAGAEAISINEKRIVNMTEIVDVNGFILINEERVISPYVVKVIGDQTYLSSALSLKVSGFIDSYQKLGKTVKMTKEKSIKIEAYNSKKKVMQLDYAKEVEE